MTVTGSSPTREQVASGHYRVEDASFRNGNATIRERILLLKFIM